MKHLPAAASLLLAILPLVAQAAPASRDLWEQEGHRFTPKVEAAYLDETKAAALAKLKSEGKELPADFLAWVDSDPVVKTTVYGARPDASGILVVLRSLELDLGKEAVRGPWTQLALAMAVVHGKAGDPELARASLAPHAPLVLKVPGDPRVRVDTHAKDRPLDVNDHIINFLEDTTIEEEVVVGWKEIPPELKYDAKGVAIPQPKAKPTKEAIREKRTRPLRAADVIASADLEKRFNDYMAEHGHPEVKVSCSGPDGSRLNWRSTSVGKVDQRGVRAAFDLFLGAYKAKGRFPKENDPKPTLAEHAAFLIRNDGDHLAEGVKAPWPRFPLAKAPWPLLTMLAHNADSRAGWAQSLREKQDIWEKYRDHGEFHGYGEYIGDIAQNGMMQNARRLAPFAFNYGSLQMMIKDGGVCGTMASMAVHNNVALGVPSSTAGQPGHCALVAFGFDPKTGTWNCHGGQYATAGDGGTHVHCPWYFGMTDAQRPMVYHQSVAQSVNFGLQSFLDAQAAAAFFRSLPEADRKAHGAAFLADAVSKAPYAMFLVDTAAASLADPAGLMAFWQAEKAAFPKDKPGCPASGLYQTVASRNLFARMNVLPAPKDAAQAKAILDFLKAEGCDDQGTLALYKTAAFGLPAFLAETEAAFKTHLASNRTPASAAAMAGTLSATASRIPDPKERAKWLLARWEELKGREMYLGKQGRHTAFLVDDAVPVLGKLLRRKPRPQADQIRDALAPLAARAKTQFAGERTPAACRALAGEIAGVGAALVKLDKAEATRFADDLGQALVGRETFTATVKGKPQPQPQRDPCADAVAKVAEMAK